MVSAPCSIFELAHNAVSWHELGDGYVQLLRFNDPDGEPFARHPLYQAMAGTSASIVLRFRTRSTTVVRLKRYNRSLLSSEGMDNIDFAKLYGRPLDLSETIDVVIDGTLNHQTLAFCELAFESGQQIAIYLPLHHQVGVQIEGDFEPVQKSSRTVLLLGDSIFQGVGLHHPSQSLANQLEGLVEAQVVNQGLSGAVIDPKLVQKLSLSSPICSIVVGLGTNDWTICDSLAEVRGQMFALLGRIRVLYPKVPVLLLTPLYRSDINEEKRMGTFQMLSQALVQATRCFAGVQVADGLSFSLRDALDDKVLHPDNKGIAFLAKSLAPMIKFQRP